MPYRRFLAVLLPLPLLAALGGAQADAADTLLSQRQPVLASSIEDDSLPAALAVDGSTTTRWASTEGVRNRLVMRARATSTRSGGTTSQPRRQPAML